jgi:hypothetical protein
LKKFIQDIVPLRASRHGILWPKRFCRELSVGYASISGFN